MWTGRFVDTREERANKFLPYTVMQWELSKCSKFVIITMPDNISPKEVVPEYEFARLVKQKIFKYTDRPMNIK